YHESPSRAHLAVYINRYFSRASVTKESSDMAIAVIYIHSFGRAIGLLPLPYLFGAELFPTRIRAIPETAGRSFEGINKLFDLKWYEIRQNAYSTDQEGMAPISAHTLRLSSAEAGSSTPSVIHGDLKEESVHDEYGRSVVQRLKVDRESQIAGG
ncbi:MAG: hypothetical protein TREMPRED_005982, partial [Tremellales sp. Tagirdzhanova-0007]